MSINSSGGDPAGFGAVLGEAARAYLKARRWLWISVGVALLNAAAWFTAMVMAMTGSLALEMSGGWQPVFQGIAAGLLMWAAGAGGSRQTAAAWMRSVQYRVAPDSYTSSVVADARRFAQHR